MINIQGSKDKDQQMTSHESKSVQIDFKKWFVIAIESVNFMSSGMSFQNWWAPKSMVTFRFKARLWIWGYELAAM